MAIRTHVDSHADPPQLEALVAQYRYGRYCEDRSLPIEDSRRLVLDRAREYLGSDDSKCVTALSSQGDLLGLVLFKLSAWDTEHFGYNVVVVDSVMVAERGNAGRAEIANALVAELCAWCKSADVRFASARVSALDLAVIHGLEGGGFRFIESWIANKYDLDRIEELACDNRYELRTSRPDDCPVMIEYSSGAFATHRFHADPGIDRDKAESLYAKWIRSAFDDDGQEILVLDVDSRPLAFMIYYRNDLSRYFGLRFAMWKMAVLDPARRGAGIGTDFFISVMERNRKDGMDVVDSGLSMRNVASMNLHIKLNFKMLATFVTFHKWFR